MFKVIDVFLELALGGKLFVELPHLFEVSEKMTRKRVEPFGVGPLEVGGEYRAHKKIVM